MSDKNGSSPAPAGHTTSDILWIDADRNIVRVNQKAADSAAKRGLTLVGMAHADFDPDFPEEHLDALFSRQEIVINYTRSTCAPDIICDHCDDFLALQDIDGKSLVVRSGRYIVTPPPLEGDALNLCRRAIDFKQVREASAAAKKIRSEFIANMNHEIRTPMNAIIGYAEMLAGCDLAPREKRFAQTIYRSGMTLVAILNDIMDLSKIESGRLKILKSPVRLFDLVNETVNLFDDQVSGKNLQLRTSIAKNTPEVVLVDGLRLKQVLSNLLSNAVKFTEHGTITLTVSADQSFNGDEATTLNIAVEDTGKGIDEKELDIIMTILNPESGDFPIEYSGRGFGLPLCGRLVSLMGGTISLKSRLGRGTTLIVSLPEVTESKTEQAEEAINQDAADKRGSSDITVLVVDDMDLIKEVFTDYFSSSDVTVLTASNGDEALKLAIENHPSIIFMDLNLAGKDGRAVTRELRANPATEDIPVIAMTGSLLEEGDYRPLFDDLLQKPFRFETLQEMIVAFTQAKPDRGSEIQDKQPVVDNSPLALHKLWNNNLNTLLEQAILTGSLSAAEDLGRMLENIGCDVDHEVVSLGRSLLACAREHDIIGVEQLLSKLQQFNVSVPK